MEQVVPGRDRRIWAMVTVVNQPDTIAYFLVLHEELETVNGSHLGPALMLFGLRVTPTRGPYFYSDP